MCVRTLRLCMRVCLRVGGGGGGEGGTACGLHARSPNPCASAAFEMLCRRMNGFEEGSKGMRSLQSLKSGRAKYEAIFKATDVTPRLEESVVCMSFRQSIQKKLRQGAAYAAATTKAAAAE